MFIVKLIVLFDYLTIFSVLSANYCEICPNHTLCLYSFPGANTECKLYDVNALLTEREIDGIVKNINERRNFIAMGLSSFLPQAANMRKIIWSLDLAMSAQRWVDQCDSTIQPDKEDECRDLGHTKVGQNIATIFGPSPGLHIKSFVELWFIPILKYRGSISYYNQSVVHGTNYFTQLIWAETEFVGCGKARFYISQRNGIVERLVCNFASKGNNHGKTVYAVGYPSTQCPNHMVPDKLYRGLCTHQINKKRPKPTTSSVTSLLRILNLSNNPIKQDIDPLRSYFKQNVLNNNKINETRNQKMRHVFFNNTYGAARRVPTLDSRKFWSMPINDSDRYSNPLEKGHSRVYHGYKSHTHNYESHMHNHDSYAPTQEENKEAFWRYDFTSDIITTNSGSDLRKYYGSPQCTRKQPTTKKNYIIKDFPTNICTRGEKCSSCAKLTSSGSPTTRNEDILCNENTMLCNECPCLKQTTTCPPNPKRCSCNVNCNCMLPCVNVKSTGASVSLNFDSSPSILLRSGDKKSTHSPVSWLLSSSIINKSFKNSNKRRNYDDNYSQVKDILRYPKLKHDVQYFYHYFDTSERKKRESEHQITFKPFWQMDEFNYKKPNELKSIRYTTFANRKNRKSRRTTRPKGTESITISLKEMSTNHSHRDRFTEKYLSFEELMHLRKITATDGELDARRKGNNNILRQATTAAVTTSTGTTSEYTTNTPFIRKKHCTRKLTCTWTALAMTGPDGKLINLSGGDSYDRGSQTPPGYVEGCSRTSTCTREFMDRNQMPLVTENESSSSNFESTTDDSDYCERRSLNIRRRDSGKKYVIITGQHEVYTPSPISTTVVLETPNNWFCNEHVIDIKREKRNSDYCLGLKHEIMNNFKLQVKKSISYSDLFYSALYKIRKFLGIDTQ